MRVGPAGPAVADVADKGSPAERASDMEGLVVDLRFPVELQDLGFGLVVSAGHDAAGYAVADSEGFEGSVALHQEAFEGRAHPKT